MLLVGPLPAVHDDGQPVAASAADGTLPYVPTEHGVAGSKPPAHQRPVAHAAQAQLTSVHATAVVLTVPAGHVSGHAAADDDWPAALPKVPAAQDLSQTTMSAASFHVPAAQSGQTHTVLLQPSVVVLRLPALHVSKMHDVAPCVGLYDPAPHCWQASDSVVLPVAMPCLPAAQRFGHASSITDWPPMLPQRPKGHDCGA